MQSAPSALLSLVGPRQGIAEQQESELSGLFELPCGQMLSIYECWPSLSTAKAHGPALNSTHAVSAKSINSAK
eukprot:13202655-Alexandrium_andersonii.AAC.1